ncbi:MAG: AAA family ATPase, partial [Succinivibrio sp.]|nr:AAA family ATPase [Succinivibrio sp.]
EYSRRKIEAMTLEQEILSRENSQGFLHEDELKALADKLNKEKTHYDELNEKLNKIKEKAKEYFDLCEKIAPHKDKKEEVNAEEKAANAENAKSAEKPSKKEKASGSKPSKADFEKLKKLREELNDMQGENPMLLPEVDAQAVCTVISEWTGIPLGRMMKDEINSVLKMSEFLQQRVIGQPHALDLIAKRLMTARANLSDPNRPIAVLMLAGPSGVGKTETALALAEQLYGTESNVITINMSEFQEAHTVSTLKGAPPGYVGYGEGGVLTEAVRRRPYSVVLLDEIEKAHKDVHEIFFQVFDKGQMEDGSGRLINFRNCVIILTTNVGDDAIMNLCQDEDNLPDPSVLEEAARPAMMKVFPAALLGRINIIPYYPLGKKALNHIVDLKLNKIVKRVKENYHAEFRYTQELRDEIISRCNNVASGARLIDAIVNNDLLPELSARFLECTMEEKQLVSATASAKDGKFVFDFETKEV